MFCLFNVFSQCMLKVFHIIFFSVLNIITFHIQINKFTQIIFVASSVFSLVLVITGASIHTTLPRGSLVPLPFTNCRPRNLIRHITRHLPISSLPWHNTQAPPVSTCHLLPMSHSRHSVCHNKPPTARVSSGRHQHLPVTAKQHGRPHTPLRSFVIGSQSRHKSTRPYQDKNQFQTDIVVDVSCTNKDHCSFNTADCSLEN